MRLPTSRDTFPMKPHIWTRPQWRSHSIPSPHDEGVGRGLGRGAAEITLSSGNDTLFHEPPAQERPLTPSLAPFVPQGAREKLPATSVSADPDIPSRACRHNVARLRGGAYYGLGPSATSYVRGVRSKNVSNTPLYCERLEQGRRAIESNEKLSPRPAPVKSPRSASRHKRRLALRSISKRHRLGPAGRVVRRDAPIGRARLGAFG